MKLMLHSNALQRVDDRLRGLNIPLELYVVDADGVIRLDGSVVEQAAVRAEAVWASLDTFPGARFRPFFGVAMENPGVKWVQTFNAGLDLPIFRDIVRRGVRLTNSSAQAVAMAEFVMGQVFAEWYPTAQYRAAQAAHEWRRIGFREISQSHWLIVGYGNIGREIARRAKAFGAHVAGVRRSPKPDEFADEVCGQGELARLLPSADVVVLACSLTEATRDMAGVDFFGRMKPGAMLVNVGRGGLVDEGALVAALDAGTPSVAILDVFREEPLPAASALWDHPKIRISAHTSASGGGTLARGDTLFLDNLALYARGAKLINEVDESFF
jgi:phosphoglycerate dehydrogenase-like enzyme